MVVVDVVVLDRQQQPVLGLSMEEFEVIEDGSQQTIEAFERVVVTGDAAASAPPAPGIQPKRPGLALVLFIDDLHMGPGQLRRSQAAAQAVIKRVASLSGEVAIISPGRGIAVSGRLPAERERLTAAMGRIRSVSPGPVPSSGEARLAERETVDLLSSTLESLAGAPGRKVLLFISPGLAYEGAIEPGHPLGPGVTRPFRGSQRADFERLLEASRRAGTTVYFLDALGLRSPFEGGGLTDKLELTRAALSEALAADSGGYTVRNANTLERDAVRIVEQSRAYYLLGYRPRPSHKDGEFRRIGVKVRRPGVTVRARKGYFPGVGRDQGPEARE
jgi:VWFA-related protein